MPTHACVDSTRRAKRDNIFFTVSCLSAGSSPRTQVANDMQLSHHTIMNSSKRWCSLLCGLSGVVDMLASLLAV